MVMQLGMWLLEKGALFGNSTKDVTPFFFPAQSEATALSIDAQLAFERNWSFNSFYSYAYKVISAVNSIERPP